MCCIRCRGVCYGDGSPKICVPLTPTSSETLSEQLSVLSTAYYDMVEWRLDFLPETTDPLTLYPQLRAGIGNVPLLITFRSRREGGQRKISAQRYAALYQRFLAENAADLLDLEWTFESSMRQKIQEDAQAQNVPVILSYHNFEKTPDDRTLRRLMTEMAAASPQFVKVACMPRSPQDVIRLLALSEEASRIHTDCRWITMSMGELGKISRVSGCVTGSEITFGTAGAASAPGQMDANLLKQALNLLRPCDSGQ